LYHPIKIVIGTLLSSCCLKSPSCDFLSNKDFLEVSSKYPLSFSIKAFFSEVEAAIKSDLF